MTIKKRSTRSARSPAPVRGAGSGSATPASVPAHRPYRFGYARISKSDGSQREDLQVNALRDAGCDHIFVDSLSGASKELPKFEEMLSMLRPGDEVLVWKLDRIGRGGARSTINSVHRVLDKQANFRSLTESLLNLGGPIRDVILALLGAFAQMERDNLIERTQAGLRAAVARGKTLGRKRSLTPTQVDFIVKMREKEGMSYQAIADLISGAKHTTVFRAYQRVLEEREFEQMQKQAAARPSGRRARVPAGSSRKPASRPGASSKRSRR